MCDPVRSPLAGTPIPSDANNLVVQALELLRQRSGCELGAHVELVKRVPAAAGLGGGSSDAATALRLANLGWGLRWTINRLAEIAAEIGSDIPFFLFGGAAICRGRGEQVERLPATPPMHFVVVKPPVSLSTGEVYRAHAAMAEHVENRDAKIGQLADLLNSMVCGRGRNAGPYLWNRLQQAASSISPWIEKLRMAFDRLDFLGHQLSGSGSAYFGVCRHAQHARRLAYYSSNAATGARLRYAQLSIGRASMQGERPWKSPRSASSSWKSRENV